MSETTDTVSERQACTHALTHWLTEARHQRQRAAAEPRRAARRQALRAFQAARLARTHADLLDSPRYGRAAAFFLTDLYSPKDLGPRDAEIERVLPLITSTLPTAGLHALLQAAELDALSERFDAAMVHALGEEYIQQQILPQTQLGRLIRPAEIADAICFLVSNSALSGELWADGGWHPSA